MPGNTCLLKTGSLRFPGAQHCIAVLFCLCARWSTTPQSINYLLQCQLFTLRSSHAGPDGPFVNNYGVWKDEFRELGLESTLDVSWDDAMCYFGEDKEVRVGRGYGR
jgi:hypothetical protein